MNVCNSPEPFLCILLVFTTTLGIFTYLQKKKNSGQSSDFLEGGNPKIRTYFPPALEYRATSKS